MNNEHQTYMSDHTLTEVSEHALIHDRAVGIWFVNPLNSKTFYNHKSGKSSSPVEAIELGAIISMDNKKNIVVSRADLPMSRDHKLKFTPMFKIVGSKDQREYVELQPVSPDFTPVALSLGTWARSLKNHIHLASNQREVIRALLMQISFSPVTVYAKIRDKNDLTEYMGWSNNRKLNLLPMRGYFSEYKADPTKIYVKVRKPVAVGAQCASNDIDLRDKSVDDLLAMHDKLLASTEAGLADVLSDLEDIKKNDIRKILNITDPASEESTSEDTESTVDTPESTVDTDLATDISESVDSTDVVDADVVSDVDTSVDTDVETVVESDTDSSDTPLTDAEVDVLLEAELKRDTQS